MLWQSNLGLTKHGYSTVMPDTARKLPPEPVHLRRADTSERFVAFAFAGADMMAEAAVDGTLTYATGAYRSKFGRPPESFVGTKLRDLIAPADHEALEAALIMLVQRGRLGPMMVRLSDPARTPLALAGIVLPGRSRPTRLCLTFARQPERAAAVLRRGTAHGFARSAEAQMRSGAGRELCLVEISGAGLSELDAGALEQALEQLAPRAQAGVLADGRYGVLGAEAPDLDTLAAPGALETALRVHGLDVTVTSTRMSLAANGLTPPQAARALRHVLNAFARDGSNGLGEAGLGGELAGYMRRAGLKADILRRVIKEGRFALAFQPIVSLATRVPHHYEALIRPRPIPDLSLAGPQEFVMLVEALGLSDELDLRVAQLACDQAAKAGTKVAFNISGHSVQNPAFRDRLLQLLGKHAACRSGLAIVEMTETAEIEDLPEALLTGQALRELGVPFCLDDFGAGAADMRILRAVTPDIVKLDGSYVPGIAAGGRERAFVAGMVEIARAMGASVVAERVETEEEAATLREFDVHFGQGWLFGRPDELPGGTKRKVGVRAGETESWG